MVRSPKSMWLKKRTLDWPKQTWSNQTQNEESLEAWLGPKPQGLVPALALVALWKSYQDKLWGRPAGHPECGGSSSLQTISSLYPCQYLVFIAEGSGTNLENDEIEKQEQEEKGDESQEEDLGNLVKQQGARIDQI